MIDSILIDTNIIIDHLRGREASTSLLTRLISERNIIICSVITRIELMSGIRPGEEEKKEILLSIFNEVEVTKEVAEIAGKYMNTFSRTYGINTANAIIAASAKCNNASLYTLNLKHFPMRDINIIKPY